MPCNEYGPEGVFPSVTMDTRGDVTFVCSADNITLRLPDFGNSEAVDVDRALNFSRGGSPRIMRDSNWPKATEINISFSVLTQAKGLELLDYLKNSIGLLTTYTDPDNRQWQGIITNPESAVVDEGNCKYSANVVLGYATLV